MSIERRYPLLKHTHLGTPGDLGSGTLDSTTFLRGDGTWSNTLTGALTLTLAGGGQAAALALVSTSPCIVFGETDQGTDEKWWDIVPIAKVLSFRATNDANTNGYNWLTVGRTGISLGDITFFNGAGLETMRLIPGNIVLINATTSISGVCRLQVGSGSNDSRATFISSNAFACAVSQGVGNGLVYIGATASASPDFIFSNAGGSPLMYISNTGAVYSETGVYAGALNATATTVFTMPSVAFGVYIFHATLSGVNDATNYSATSLIQVNGTTAVITTLDAGAAMTITLSGVNVQVTQTSGISQNVSWRYLRVS